MVEPKRLTMGVDCKSPNMHEEETRVAVLQATVEHYLPAFAKAIADLQPELGEKDSDILYLHQDAFASGYDEDEYTLLGMAVKYAGPARYRCEVHRQEPRHVLSGVQY